MSDPKRFEALVVPHLDAAYNLARWLARDAHDAEDVVQDACVRALKYIASVERGDARAWFLTIVRNAFYDWLRRNRPAEIVPGEDEAIERAVDPAAIDPEQAAVRLSDARALSDAIAALPLQFREVLILRDLHELSAPEVAAQLAISVEAVKSRLHRARSQLRATLMDSGYWFEGSEPVSRQRKDCT